MDVFHFFLLKEKSGAKKFKANPTAPRVLPCPRTTAVIKVLVIHLLTTKLHKFLQAQLFQMLIVV
jgi:hypothetical protein